MDAPPSASIALEWQQTRREQGLPTVSVLIGPIGLGVRTWRQWANARSAPLAQTASHDWESSVRTWVATAFATGDPVEMALNWVRSRAAERPELTRLTPHDLDQLWRTLPTIATDPVATAAYTVLREAVAGRAIEPERFLHAFQATDSATIFAAVCGLYPEPLWPSWLLFPPDKTDMTTWFVETIRTLEFIAVAVPRLPVGVCISIPAFEMAIEAMAGTRAATLAREGRIHVPSVTPTELDELLRVAGVKPPPSAETVRRLTTDGLAPEVAAAFVAVAKAVRTARPADDFRSEPERFLFEQLESLPDTAGLFRSNRELDFLHGLRAAEADLVAERLKLVVEVDGGWYHLTADQYRRDRRKDWLYQRHGFLVLRFLAEDVVDDLETIVATIREAIALRRTAHRPGGIHS